MNCIFRSNGNKGASHTNHKFNRIFLERENDQLEAITVEQKLFNEIINSPSTEPPLNATKAKQILKEELSRFMHSLQSKYNISETLQSRFYKDLYHSRLSDGKKGIEENNTKDRTEHFRNYSSDTNTSLETTSNHSSISEMSNTTAHTFNRNINTNRSRHFNGVTTTINLSTISSTKSQSDKVNKNYVTGPATFAANDNSTTTRSNQPKYFVNSTKHKRSTLYKNATKLSPNGYNSRSHSTAINALIKYLKLNHN